jgi:predicted GNAT superfamily acetyltransferase
LNIGHLGARASTYYADYYGEMKGINAGVPSDRLLVEWRLDDVNVARRARHLPLPPSLAPFTRQVSIPPDFAELLAIRPEQALAERLRVRVALTAAFDSHEEITGFDRQNGAYLLQRRKD